MSPPYLTERGRACLPAMANKVREMLDKAASPKGSAASIPKNDSFAARLLGCALSPQLDPNDFVLREVFAAMEAGLSSDERKLFDHQLPYMRGIVQRIIRPDDASDLSPSDVRAVLFATFANGRDEEGTMGENLHIGVRRVFERLYEFFSGLQSLANRSGFYRPSDLFEPAYRIKGDAARAPINDLLPNQPGEKVPVARSRLKSV